MKGSLKTLRTQELPKKTNFNDWCDPKCSVLRRRRKQDNLKGKDSDIKLITQKSSISSETSVEVEKIRAKIKLGYPLLDLKEIRTVKLPFHESLLLNLKEDGFFATYKFISDLIDLDEQWHEQREKYFNIKNRPFLKLTKPMLNLLCKELSNAEIAKIEGNKTQEMRSLLNLAIKISNQDNKAWQWLSEEIYEQCVDVADHFSSSNIDQELEATAKYMFARFLVYDSHDPIRAKHLVEESMQLSEGKFWNPSEIIGVKSDILYFESCLLLHKIFLEMAHDKKDCDIESAIQLCRSSLHCAKQINSKSAEARALMTLVIIYIAADQLSPVLGHLENYMKLCKEQEDIQGLCEGYILLANYHELTDEEDLVIKDIHELLRVAEENNIIEMMAKAHHKLAIFYLSQGKEKELQEHSTKAYSYYTKLNSKLEIEETRCLTGIAQAEEIMPQYLNILLESENLEMVEFKMLMFWKTLHIPFFTNVKLFQPEAYINSELKDRIETLKNEELLGITKIKQVEMASTISQSRFTLKPLVSISSSSRMSKSVMSFQRDMKIAIDSEATIISFV